MIEGASRTPSARFGRLALYTLLLAASGAALFPFLFALVTSFKPPAETFAPGLWPRHVTFENYVEVVRGTPLFLRWVLNSALVAAVSVVIVGAMSLMGGYAFARIAFAGRQVLFLVMLGSMMVPGQVLWIPNYASLGQLGWVNSYWGLLPGIVGSVTSGIFMVGQFLKGIPKDLEEAATLDGLSRYGIFWYLILPLAGPVVAAMSITAFMASWNNFAWPVIVLNSPELFTLPIGLNFFKGLYVTKWSLVMAGSMFNTIPVLLVFVFFQRHFIKNVATTGMKE